MIYCMVYYAYFTQSRYAEVHVSGLKIYGYNARILFFFFLWWPTKPPFWFTKLSICYLWFVTKIKLQDNFGHILLLLVFFDLIFMMVIENRVSVLMWRAKKVVDIALLHLRFRGEGVKRTRECQNVTFEPCSRYYTL